MSHRKPFNFRTHWDRSEGEELIEIDCLPFYLWMHGATQHNASPFGHLNLCSPKTSAFLFPCLAFASFSHCEVSKRALCMGLLWRWKWVCTQLLPQSELLQLAWLSEEGENRAGSSQRETSLSMCTFCRSQLWWLPLVPPACWNALRLRIQLNVKQRKSCNYPLSDFLFQIFFSEVGMQKLFCRKLLCWIFSPRWGQRCFLFPWSVQHSASRGFCPHITHN